MVRLLALLAFSVIGAVPSTPADDSIDDFIESEMPPPACQAWPTPSWPMARSPRSARTASSGSEATRTVTPDTAFLTGSISKSFTALAVMQLVEAGKVDLDAEVSQYLDGFSGRPAGAITIRQLLSHTSGFSTLQGNASHTGCHRRKGRACAPGRPSLHGVTPAYEPDERWEYSNTNYQILGRLIEVVSGQEFQAYIAANILEPVGMEHSFVADGEIHESMATGHTAMVRHQTTAGRERH